MKSIKDRRNIPKGWKFGELGNFLVDISDGGTPSRSKPEYFGGKIPWVVVNDIKPRIKETQNTLTDEGLNNSSARLWPAGTVILSFGATIGEVGIADVAVTTKQGIAGIIPKDDLLNTYLYYLLASSKNLLHKLSSGSTIKEVRPSVIKQQIQVLVPSIREQRKISEILGTVDEDIAKTQEVIKVTEKLKRGLMRQLFTRGIGHMRFKKTRIGEIPEKWEIAKLGDIANVERGKFSHRPRNAPEFYGGKYPFIQTGDVISSDGKITTYTQTLNERGLTVSRIFKKRTIVMTIAANIGNTGILEFDSCFPDSLVGISSKSGMDSIFLEYFLRTRKEYLNSIATQSAQKNINLQKLEPMLVVKPVFKEQQKIAEILSTVDEKISANKKLKAKLTLLKKGLMQDLLSGRVRVVFKI